jgi:hypothetical protein
VETGVNVALISTSGETQYRPFMDSILMEV